MQETQVRSLIGQITQAAEQLSPCTAATNSMLESLGAVTAEPTCHNYRSLCTLEPVLHNKKRHRNEEPTRSN